MRFSDFQLEDLKSRADLVSLVGKRVSLRRAGKDHVGLCPFHGEKSPSFYVVPGRQLWHCFGCGETGDVFKFFMKLDGLPFVEAVNMVARESGVILVEEKLDPEEARRRARLEELTDLLERAVRFYENKLWHAGGKLAQQHLVQRGVLEETARRFQIGFGGAGMDELARALSKAGASVELAVEAGLLIPSQRGGSPFDRFHGRLIVPIKVPRPPNGRAVALGGRFLEGVTPSRHDKKPAKYINSPETPLYQKGSVLFGLDQARDAIRKAERAVVVEGYFDVIGVHQEGLRQAVATCGTALTPMHLDLLTRTGAREIVFLFDGDEAGSRAAKKASELCAKAQVPAKVATLPDGVDPDEFARKGGAEAMDALMARAKPAIEHLIDRALSELGPRATVEERVRVVHAVRDVVLSAPEGLSRELYVTNIAERLGVSVGAVQEIVYAAPDKPASRRAAPSPVQEQAPSPEPDAAVAAEPRPRPRPERDRDRSSPPAPASDRTVGKFQPPPVAKSEVGVVVAMLAYPVALAPVVSQDGVLAEFASPELRALGEAVLSRVAEGIEVAAAELIPAVRDPRLKVMVEEGLTAAAQEPLEASAQHLLRLLDRLRREIRRKKAFDAMRKGLAPGADAEAQRAFEEEQSRILEESRELHRRIRERGQPR